MAPSGHDVTLNETQIFEIAYETCSIPPVLYDTNPVVGIWHVHDFMLLIAGACLIFTFVSSFLTAIWHLRNYTVPREQRQIVRIIWTPFVYGNLYFFSLWFYKLQSYATAVADLYEVFALVAIYLLFLAYVCPDHEDYESHFKIFQRQRNRKSKKEEQKKHPGGGSLLWFQLYSFGVLQIFPTKIATSIATWVTTATMCPLTKSLLHAGLYLRIINGVLIAILVFCVVQVYRGIKPTMTGFGHKGGKKLVMFKIMVILVQIQPVIFQILVTGHDLHPTTHMSILDYVYGIPYFITVIEMTFFSIIFVFIFGAGEYKTRSDPEHTGADGKPIRMEFWAAVLHTVNYWDVVTRAWVVLTFAGYFHERKLEKLNATNGNDTKASENSETNSSDGYERQGYGDNDYGNTAQANHPYTNGPYVSNTHGNYAYESTAYGYSQ